MESRCGVELISFLFDDDGVGWILLVSLAMSVCWCLKGLA